MKIPPVKVIFNKEDRENILREIDRVLQSGMLTLHKYNKKFEEDFQKLTNTKYTIACNSGTSAIEIPLRSLNVKGKTIIIPTDTFGATAAAAINAGAKAKFCDIADDLCMDPISLNEQVDNNTAGIILVHIAGHISKNLNEIKKICEDNNLFLIEDAAHAHGSKINNQPAGSLGIAAGFSFYPTKVMTSAEGGIVCTNDSIINERARIFRDQGKENFSSNVLTELGYNWRMSEVHAVIGIYQLRRLQQFIEDRRRIAKIYDKGLKEIDWIKPLKIQDNIYSNYYKYVAFIDENINKQELKKNLKEKFSVSLTGEVYEPVLHQQPIYQRLLGYKDGDFPNAERLTKTHLCLPVYAAMAEQEAEYVLESLKKVI